MTLLVPNEGEVLLLERFMGKSAAENITLKLFKSNTTPGEGDTTATYTVADFSGYADKTLVSATWAAASPGAPSSIAYAQQTWTSDAAQAAQLVYGYYAVGATSAKVLWAERFSDGPYSIANNGDAIKVTPTVTGD